MAHLEEVQRAKATHVAEVMARPNVVGVGAGFREVGGRLTDELCVVVMVRQKVPKQALSRRELVPQQLDAVPTDVVQVGEIRALQTRTDRWRPARGGVSLGHFKITAGTFGCVVRDRSSGQRLILSNNHVLANSNDASQGDAILQPGAYDGGQLGRDELAVLERFVPIQFSSEPGTCSIARGVALLGNSVARLLGSSHRLDVIDAHPQAINRVDAALARPHRDDDILDEILEIGLVNGVNQATLGMAVRKSGRTTGLTTGEVIVLNATVDVGFGAGRTARFEDQIVAGPMSQGGDSGSLVLDEDSHAIGLLFAGSERTTIFNPFQFVLDALQVEITPVEEAGAEQTNSQGAVSAASRAQAVKEAHQESLMAKPNVVGVGLGTRKRGGVDTGEVALVVMVERKLPREQLLPEDIIPAAIEGVPVDVQEVGTIRAL